MRALLENAQYPVGESRLYVAATRALAAQGSLDAAAQFFVNQVRQDRELLTALCRQYLEICQRDMRGDSLRGGGRHVDADKAIVRVPPAPQPHDSGKGQYMNADKAMMIVPEPLSPQGDGDGRVIRADKAIPVVPSPVAPMSLASVRNTAPTRPGPDTRELSIIGRIAKERAVTIMESLKIDGRPIGDWTIGECSEAAGAKLRDGHILKAVASHYRNADPRAVVRDLIKVEDLQKIVQKAAEKADAA